MTQILPGGASAPTPNTSVPGDTDGTTSMLPSAERIAAACAAADLTLDGLAERLGGASREFLTIAATLAWPGLVERAARELGVQVHELLEPCGRWFAPGDEIRREREEQDLDPEQLARRAGVQVDVVHAIEADPTAVKVGEFVAVLHALGLEDRKPGGRTVTLGGVRFSPSGDSEPRWEPHTQHTRHDDGTVEVQVLLADGAAMRVARLAAGLSPREVAERLLPSPTGKRVSAEHVTVWETGADPANFSDVLALGRAVGLEDDVYDEFTTSVSLRYDPRDLRTVREQVELSRHGLAHALGLPWATAEWVRAAETGTTVLDRRSLVAWCSATECSLVELTGRPQHPER